MFKTRKVSEDEIVLVISGSMTGESVGLFERALDSLQKSNYQTITLDLTKVPSS
jgi:anti-anti-sigma regulatory factor